MTGVVRFAWDLAVQQSKEGHQVEIFCPIEKGKSHARSVLGIDIYWYSLWKRWRTRRLDMSYLAPLWLKYMRSKPVDVTHVHDNPFMGMRIRTKILVMQYESPPLISSLRYQQAVGRCEAVISCSNYIKQLVIEAASVQQSRSTSSQTVWIGPILPTRSASWHEPSCRYLKRR